MSDGAETFNNWPMTTLYSIYYEFSKRYPHGKSTAIKQDSASAKTELLFRMVNYTIGEKAFRYGVNAFISRRYWHLKRQQPRSLYCLFFLDCTERFSLMIFGGSWRNRRVVTIKLMRIWRLMKWQLRGLQRIVCLCWMSRGIMRIKLQLWHRWVFWAYSRF